MTSSNGNIFRVTGPLCGEFTGPGQWRGQWRGALMFLPEASFGLRVLSLPASVCLCVRVSVCVCVNHGLVRTITHHSFKLESPNLEQRCKRPWLRCLLFLGIIDLDLQGQILLESQILPNFEFVRPITHQPFMLESPNLDRKCILALLRFLLILGKIGCDLHQHFQSWNRFFYQIYLRSVCIIFSETRRL